METEVNGNDEYLVGGGGPAGVGNTALETITQCPVTQGLAPNYAYHDAVEIEGGEISNFVDRVIPLNGLSSDPYEFIFDTMADFFVDLSSIIMYVRMALVKEDDGSTPGAKDNDLTLCDNLINALWRGVDTKLNDVVIHPESATLQGYRAQIEYLLSVEKGITHSFTAGGFGQTEANRKAHFGKVQLKEFDICGPIALDILRSGNHLAPGHKLSLTFHRADHQFVLINSKTETPTKYRLVIKDIYMEANRIRLLPEVASTLLSGPQNYQLTHTELKDYPLPTGQKSWNIKVYAGGVLPHQVVLGFVSTAAFTGGYKENPFKFDNFGLNHACLRVNGVRVPQDPLKPEFDKNLFARELLHVYQNTGKFRNNTGNYIDAGSFKSGACLIPFDLTPDQCNNAHKHASMQGSLDVELGWAESLSENVTIIVLSVFNQVIQFAEPGAPPLVTIY